jgi:hypothetical protein
MGDTKRMIADLIPFGYPEGTIVTQGKGPNRIEQ